MSFYQVFEFLRELNANNHTAWMKDNRESYEKSRDFVAHWAEQLIGRLAETDPDFWSWKAKRLCPGSIITCFFIRISRFTKIISGWG